VSIRIVVLIVLWVGVISAQENEINISFSELPELIKNSSPQSKILQARYDVTRTKSDIELQWSNPELYYDFEQVEFAGQNETEQAIVLSKTFDFPWTYFKQRNIRKTADQAAAYILNYNKNNLLVNLKNNYVYLSLLQNISNQVDELADTLNELKQSLLAQKEEGAVSTLDADLLAMNLFDFESEALEVQKEFRTAKNNWVTSLGYDLNTKINLTDSIKYVNVILNNVEISILAKNHLGFLAHQKRLEVMNQRISLEKWNAFPLFSLHGGYKKVDPQWEGFVVGVSLPLPILNQNGPQIEKQKSEYRILENETFIYKQNLQSKISNLIAVIRDKSELLNKHQQNENIVGDMIAAYREGIWSLPDLLNAMQMVRENKLQHVEQLTSYYQAIFELEAISGQQLVSF